jgi:hypothetical protein
MSADYIRPVPKIDLPDDELAAVAAAIRQSIVGDRYPHAPRLDPLRAALGKLEAAHEPTPRPKAPPAAKVDKGARSAKATAPKTSPGGCRPTADRACVTVALKQKDRLAAISQMSNSNWDR